MNSPIGELTVRLREAAFNAVSEKDIVEIFNAIVAKAKKGDLTAAKLLFAHVLPTTPMVMLNVAPERNEPRRIHVNGDMDREEELAAREELDKLRPGKTTCKHGNEKQHCSLCGKKP